MPKYLAKYTFTSVMCDGGCWVPDLETHIEEYKFDAKTDDEARKIAEEHKYSVGSNYFGPKVTLEFLMQIKEVKVEVSKDVKVKIVELNKPRQLNFIETN